MDMSMDMSDMSPGRSATGIYIAPNYDLAKMYWMFVGGAIAIATATNLKEYIEYKLRFPSPPIPLPPKIRRQKYHMKARD
jgi:hypothetical protein